MFKISDLSVWQIYHVSKWVCEKNKTKRHHTIHLIKTVIWNHTVYNFTQSTAQAFLSPFSVSLAV